MPSHVQRVVALAGLAAGLVLGAVPGARASSILWTLENVTFDDGGTAHGTFTTDSATGGLLGFDIVTTPGTTLAGFTYNPQTVNFVDNNLDQLNSFLIGNDIIPIPYDLQLTFVHPLTAGLPVDPIIPGNPPVAAYSLECNDCNPFRFVESGFAVAPEPATLAVFGIGLAGLGVALRRRTQRRPYGQGARGSGICRG